MRKQGYNRSDNQSSRSGQPARSVRPPSRLPVPNKNEPLSFGGQFRALFLYFGHPQKDLDPMHAWEDSRQKARLFSDTSGKGGAA